jgi:hypothetical protein
MQRRTRGIDGRPVTGSEEILLKSGVHNDCNIERDDDQSGSRGAGSAVTLRDAARAESTPCLSAQCTSFSKLAASNYLALKAPQIVK